MVACEGRHAGVRPLQHVVLEEGRHRVEVALAAPRVVVRPGGEGDEELAGAAAGTGRGPAMGGGRPA